MWTQYAGVALVLGLLVMPVPLFMLLVPVDQGNGGIIVTVENDICNNSGCKLIPVSGAIIASVWFSPSGKQSLASQTTGASGSVVLSVPQSAVGLKINAAFPSLPSCPDQKDKIRDPASTNGPVLFVTRC